MLSHWSPVLNRTSSGESPGRNPPRRGRLQDADGEDLFPSDFLVYLSDLCMSL